MHLVAEAVAAQHLGDAVLESGREQCPKRMNALGLASVRRGHSSWLVIAGLGDLDGVAGPVASGLVRPADGGGGGEVEEVGEDGGGYLGGEVDERGAA
jgi:hypothetical protein